MNIKLSEGLDKKLKSASDVLGFDEQRIIERAILFYLDAIEKQIELKREFIEWDNLSDEAIADFEAALC